MFFKYYHLLALNLFTICRVRGNTVFRFRLILLSDLSCNVTYFLVNVLRNLRTPLQGTTAYVNNIRVRVTDRNSTYRVLNNLSGLTT